MASAIVKIASRTAGMLAAVSTVMRSPVAEASHVPNWAGVGM
jgi:hypothetical protein